MRIKVVIFDYGNTLVFEVVDWDASEHKGAEYAFEKLAELGIVIDRTLFVERLTTARKQNREMARETLVEISALETLDEVVHSFTDGKLSRSELAMLEDAFFRKEFQRIRPLPNAEEVLRQLSYEGFKLGLISNATSGNAVRLVLQEHHLLHWFQASAISSDVGFRKPKSEIFQYMLQALNVEANEAIMVGDSIDTDVLGARNAGLRSIWLDVVATDSVSDSVKPDAVAGSLKDVLDIVYTWNS